jgi:hypothetical protein
VHRRHVCSFALACLALALPAAATRGAAQTTAAAPAPAPPQTPPPRSPWRLGTELAFTDISGNRQLQLFQSTVTIARQMPETFNFTLKLEGQYGESNHQEAAKSAAAHCRLDWTAHALVSPFLGLDVEYDHVRLINARVSGGVGVNFNLSYREPTHATIAFGLIEEYVNYAAPTVPSEVNDTRFHARLALLQTLRPGVQVEFNAKYQPATARLWDYLFKADVGIRVAITNKLSWRTAYTWNRTSAPPAGVRPDDRTLTTGLLIQWW